MRTWSKCKEEENEMTTLTLGCIAALNLGLGVALALSALWTIERLGADVASVGAVGAAVLAVWAQSRVGEAWLAPTLPEFKAFVLAAVAGGVAGLVLTFTTVRPEAQ